MRPTTKTCAMIGALVLGLTACGDIIESEPEDDTVMVQGSLSDHLAEPIFTINASDEAPGMVFGYTQELGFHWARRVDAEFLRPDFDATLIASAQQEFGDESLGDLFGGGDEAPGAITFNASSGGNTAFSASLNSAASFNPTTPATSSFSAQTPAAADFNTAAGSSFSGGSCDLGVICDFFGIFICEGFAGGGGPECSTFVSQCRSQIYRAALPPSVSPYICAAVDALQCLLPQLRSGFVNEQSAAACFAGLQNVDFEAGFGSEPEPEPDPFDSNNFDSNNFSGF